LTTRVRSATKILAQYAGDHFIVERQNVHNLGKISSQSNQLEYG